MSDEAKIQIYYNSACPVCKAGIEGQMGKAQSCEMQWKDVHSDNALALETHSDLEFIRERLHVIDAQGQVKIGFDAALEIWRNSPQEKWKAALFGLPLVRQLGGVLYNLFAAALYRWNKSKQRW